MLSSGCRAECRGHGRGIALGLIFGLLALPSQSSAQNLVGKRVTVIRWEAEFRAENNAVIGTSELGKNYEVYSAKGSKLFVRERDGYLSRKDVVPYEAAIGHFTSAIKRKSSAENFYHRAVVWKERDEQDEALKDYNEALRLDPKFAEVYNARANLWKQKGELDKALDDYGEAVRLDPTMDVAFSNRGTVWIAKGDYDKALSDYDAAIRLDPKNAKAYENRGAVWRKQNDVDKAMTDYNEALRLDPSFDESRLQRGNLWRLRGEYDKAAGDFNELIRRNPKHANAYLNRALVWTDQGIYISAVADYEQHLQLDPDSAQGHVRFAWFRATCPDESMRDGRRALELVTKVTGLMDWKNSLEYHETMAAAYAEVGDFEKAEEWQTKVFKRVLAPLKLEHEARLKLYQARKPYRVPVKDAAK